MNGKPTRLFIQYHVIKYVQTHVRALSRQEDREPHTAPWDLASNKILMRCVGIDNAGAKLSFSHITYPY